MTLIKYINKIDLIYHFQIYFASRGFKEIEDLSLLVLLEDGRALEDLHDSASFLKFFGTAL